MKYLWKNLIQNLQSLPRSPTSVSSQQYVCLLYAIINYQPNSLNSNKPRPGSLLKIHVKITYSKRIHQLNKLNRKNFLISKFEGKLCHLLLPSQLPSILLNNNNIENKNILNSLQLEKVQIL
jgi:hypothetical protein